ncbi:aldehyde dehydrogenase [Neobacillus sp. YIM B02564]|uniref:Aldehyde dehydrogenase n=1 Tax=Neobacillus paridis TaxID=2803862 RepID=A0ABS1TUG2_9BACI|nr:aldehyde dehydrogenase family protein [Neobacillus paridis]MBL4954951.1 aldehyde dehydrogenase [Neobacillus paridis]
MQTKTAVLRNFINGEWKESASINVREIVSPVTGEIIYRAPDSTEEEIAAAVAAAKKAQVPWEAATAWERGRVCYAIADAIDRNKEKLSRALTLEQGKPYEAEALPDIEESAELFRIAAEDAKRMETAIIPSLDKNKRIFTFRKANGVYGIIIPWNFPTLMLAEFVAPAIAAGNTIVLKPSEYTPGIISLFTEIMHEADIPPGVLNIIYGDGKVGQQLIEHPGVDAIGFIGSHTTAEKIVRAAGLKPSIIEASGNGPTIVCEDADLDAAAKGSVHGGFFNAGQVCCATARVLVHEKVHDAFVERVVEEAEKWPLGDPFDVATKVGPMNNEATASKMESHVQDALAKGSEVLLGGRRQTNCPTNLYFQPTVIDKVGLDTFINKHETFGPIVPIITVKSDEEAIEIANDSYLGLQSAVYTKSSARAFKYMNSLKTGNTIINEHGGYWEPHVPFGGAAGTRTGWGRIGGRYTMLDMTHLRTVTWDFSI